VKKKIYINSLYATNVYQATWRNILYTSNISIDRFADEIYSSSRRINLFCFIKAIRFDSIVFHDLRRYLKTTINK